MSKLMNQFEKFTQLPSVEVPMLFTAITQTKEETEEFICLSKEELDSLVLANLSNYKANSNARKIKINKTILKDLDDLAIDLD